MIWSDFSSSLHAASVSSFTTGVFPIPSVKRKLGLNF